MTRFPLPLLFVLLLMAAAHSVSLIFSVRAGEILPVSDWLQLFVPVLAALASWQVVAGARDRRLAAWAATCLTLLAGAEVYLVAVQDLRYLRPDHQDPQGTAVGDLGMAVAGAGAKAAARPAYPERLAEQASAVRQVLVLTGAPLSAGQVAAQFTGAPEGTVDEVLELLVTMGQARQVAGEVVAYAA